MSVGKAADSTAVSGSLVWASQLIRYLPTKTFQRQSRGRCWRITISGRYAVGDSLRARIEKLSAGVCYSEASKSDRGSPN